MVAGYTIIDIDSNDVDIIGNDEFLEPEIEHGLVALARRCTRLRAGLVIHHKTDFSKAAGDSPAAFCFLGRANDNHFGAG